MTFGERLKRKIEEVGETQVSLANYIGSSRQTVSQWIDGKTLPNAPKLLKAAIFLKTNPFSLMFGVDCESTKIADSLNLIGESKKVNIFGWDLKADESQPSISPPFYVSDKSFALKVTDDSMTNFYAHSPTFRVGTIIIVDPESKIEANKYVIAKEKNNPKAIPIFRKYTESTSGRRLMPLNGALFEKENADNFDIFGVVVASMNLNL